MIRSEVDKKLWIKISLKPQLRCKIEKQAKAIDLCINPTNDNGHEKETSLLQCDYNNLICKPPMNYMSEVLSRYDTLHDIFKSYSHSSHTMH